MPALAHDLFLLMINLSRLRDRELMVRTFVEGLAAAREGLQVWLRDTPPLEPRVGVPVTTAEHAFGHVEFGGTYPTLPPKDRSTLNNAVVMLAVLLENRLRAERVESEKARLDLAVAERTRALEQAAQELKEAEARARQAQKLEAVGRLAGGVAHDFNNLLTVVFAGIGSLEESVAPSDPRTEILADIREATERARELARQLLTISRRQAVQPSVVDLSQVVDNLRLLQRLVGEHVRLSTRLARPLSPVRIDVGQLEQVIVNLVVNARDAVGAQGHITVETAEVPPEVVHQLQLAGDRDWVLLAVHDDGAGMDEATQARLFEPFFTTKQPGQGTGLGLATVYGIVRQAGGEIHVESAPGRGSHFRVYLPSVGGDAQPRDRPPRASGVSAAAGEPSASRHASGTSESVMAF